MDVLLQAFAVEPGFAAVDVADVKKVLVGTVLRTAVAADDEYVVFG